MIGEDDCMTIKENVHHVCSGIIAMLVSNILFFSNPHNPFSDKNRVVKGKVFQVFAIDILVDKNLKAWLLDISENPGLGIHECKEIVGCNHNDCPVSETDLKVKR